MRALSGPGKRREFKKEHIDNLIAFYKKNGCRKTLKEFRIGTSLLYRILKDNNVERVFSDRQIQTVHSSDTKKAALEYLTDHGASETSIKFGISRTTIVNWANKYGYLWKSPKRKEYTTAFKKEVSSHAEIWGATDAERKFNVCRQTIGRWLKERRDGENFKTGSLRSLMDKDKRLRDFIESIRNKRGL